MMSSTRVDSRRRMETEAVLDSMGEKGMTDPIDIPLRGELRQGERLDRYTSWRVGGPADRFYMPADGDDLAAFLRTLPAEEPVYWIGLGSNLLVRDGGIRGTVIYTRGRLKQMQLAGKVRVYVEAGVPCALAARFCGDNGLVGAEFLAGIPGTLGGALAMNAGAFGGETWDRVERVTTLDRAGCCRQRGPGDFTIGYRSVKGVEGEWFVSAVLKLVPGDSRESQAKIRALLAKRARTQPTNVPSCGSVFRNPPGDFAARLIESCGLKGYRLGGACVSDKHANFIVNTGGASARDLEALIMMVRDVVADKHGILLVPEVRIVGLAGEAS